MRPARAGTCAAGGEGIGGWCGCAAPCARPCGEARGTSVRWNKAEGSEWGGRGEVDALLPQQLPWQQMSGWRVMDADEGGRGRGMRDRCD